MSDTIKKCPDCETRVRKFERVDKIANSWLCRCVGCGREITLFFLPGSKSEAFVMDDAEGAAAAEAPDAGVTPAEPPAQEAVPAASAAAPSAPQEKTRTRSPADGSSGDPGDPDAQGAELPDDETKETFVMTSGQESENDTPDGADEKAPHWVNVQIGRNVRELRQLRGLSQQRLARQCGITFQQIQKFERGANRVSPNRMYDIARALGVPVARLWQGVEDAGGPGPQFEKHEIEVIRHLRSMPEAQRSRVIQLARAIAGGDEQDETPMAAE